MGIPILLGITGGLILRQDFLNPKFLAFSSPFMLLLVSQTYLTIDRTAVRRVVAAFGVAIAVIALIRFNTPEEYGRRQNVRDAVEVLNRTDASESSIIIMPGIRMNLLYYGAEELLTRDLLGEVPKGIAIPEIKDFLKAKLKRNPDVYYLQTRWSARIPEDSLSSMLDSMGDRIEEVKFNPRLWITHWRLSANPQRPQRDTP